MKQACLFEHPKAEGRIQKVRQSLVPSSSDIPSTMVREEQTQHETVGTAVCLDGL